MLTPLNIFIAYSRKDEGFLNELRNHLTPLERSGKVKIWYDGKIVPGDVWESTIKKNLHESDIILLLVSSDALASDFFYEKELSDALERHHKGTARVVPLIVRPCDWQDTPLGAIQALPKDGLAVSEWSSRDAAYTNGVASLKSIMDCLYEQQKYLEDHAEKQRLILERATLLKEEEEKQHWERETQQRPNSQNMALNKLIMEQKEEAQLQQNQIKKDIEIATNTNKVPTPLNNNSFWQKYGATLKRFGAIGGAVALLLVLLGANLVIGVGYIYISAFVAILVLIIFGVRFYKYKVLNGALTFKEAFWVGCMIGILFTALWTISCFIGGYLYLFSIHFIIQHVIITLLASTVTALIFKTRKG